MCVDDDENAISKKPPLLIGQDTQHKLGVAFMVRECKNDKYHYAYYYGLMPLSHRFFVHLLFPLNLQGNPFKIMSLPLLKLIIVCARHYSHRRISLSKDVGRDL